MVNICETIHVLNQQKILKGLPLIPQMILKKIDKQIEFLLCKIYCNKSQGKGSGFLCKIPYPDFYNFLPVLITNNHVINELDISFDIKISFSNDNNRNFPR